MPDFSAFTFFGPPKPGEVRVLPFSVAASTTAPRFLFATTNTDDKIRVMDLDAFAADDTTAWVEFEDGNTASPTNTAPYAATYHASTGDLYFSNYDSGQIFRYAYDGSGDRDDPASYTRTAFKAAGSKVWALHATDASGTPMLYWSTYTSGYKIERVPIASPGDAATLVVESTSAKGNPAGLTVIGDDLYYALQNSFTGGSSEAALRVVDLTGTIGSGVIGTAVDSIIHAFGVGQVPDEVIYGANGGSHGIKRYGPLSDSPTASTLDSAVSAGYCTDIEVTGTTMYAALSAVGGGIEIYDLSDDSVVDTIPTAGWRPRGIALA